MFFANAFIDNQSDCAPLMWMFAAETIKFGKFTLRVVYNKYNKSYEDEERRTSSA